MTKEFSETPLEYNVIALSLKQLGAITYFKDNLPVSVMSTEGRGYGEMYSALLEYYKLTKSDPIDEVTFRSWLEQETDIYKALGGRTNVDLFFEIVNSLKISTPQAVTTILKSRYKKSKQSDLIGQLSTLDPKEVSRATDIATEIQKLSTFDDTGFNRLLTGEVIAKKAEGLWELPAFLSTQFKSLNKALSYSGNGGFCRGTVNSILAISGQGKSSLARSLMVHWLDNGHRVLYFNYEEAEDHWDRVLFTQVTGQNIYKKDEIGPQAREDLTNQFKKRMGFWQDRLMVEHNPETVYFEDLEARIRSLHSSRPGGLTDVIIIDTIQSIYLKEGNNMPRWGQFEHMMTRLERLAKDTRTVIIITAQENRDRMKERREVVQQSDAGGSLAIMQKSTVAIFITQSKLENNDDAMDEMIMQLQIPKNRITGTTFMLDPPLVRYNDSTKSYEPFEPADPTGPLMFREDLEDFV